MSLERKFKIFSNTHGPSEFNLAIGEYIVGRGRKVDLSISHHCLSRKHLKIIVTDKNVILIDLETTNGTWLNDVSCKANEQYILGPDDRISFSEDDLYIEFHEEVIEQPAKSDDALNRHRKEKSLVDFVLEKADLKVDEDLIDSIDDDIDENNDETELDNNVSYIEKRKPRRKNSKHINSSRTRTRNRNFNKYSEITNSIGNNAVHIDESAAIESMAQAKQQLDAQQEASEIEMLEIKRIEIESQVKALRIREAAEKEADKLLKQAKNDAHSILVNAQDKAQEILRDGYSESEEILDEAEDEADEILDDAKLESQKILDDAKLESQKIIDKAEKQAENILTKVEVEKRNLIDLSEEKLRILKDDISLEEKKKI